MKVLYIDPFSSSSHANFNRMHIEAIRKVTKDIHFVFKENYWKEVGVQVTEVCYAIPSSYFGKNKGGLINRFYMCLVLWKIRQNVPLNQYDKIIFAAYEEISLFFAFYTVPLYLINHNNISTLNNRVKRFFFKKISRRNTHIVLEPYIKDYLQSIGIPKIEVVRHGLIAPYSISSSQTDNSLLYKKYIFSPSMQSVDNKFVKELVGNKSFLTYLEKHNLFLVLRSKTLSTSSPNIKILSHYMSKEEYIAYFLHAAIIILIYPQSFRYRISGALLEAISCGKETLMSDIKAFRQYESLFGLNAYFSTSNQLMQCIDIALRKENPKTTLTNAQRLDYMPNYWTILK